MNENFNKDTARKDLPLRRPLNVTYTPGPNQIWVYFDVEDEGAVQWLVRSINENGFASLEKRSGRDVGFLTSYESTKLEGKRWQPLEPNRAHQHVLWPCPECGADEPVYAGDYMCQICRESLDKG